MSRSPGLPVAPVSDRVALLCALSCLCPHPPAPSHATPHGWGPESSLLWAKRRRMKGAHVRIASLNSDAKSGRNASAAFPHSEASPQDPVSSHAEFRLLQSREKLAHRLTLPAALLVPDALTPSLQSCRDCEPSAGTTVLRTARSAYMTHYCILFSLTASA